MALNHFTAWQKDFARRMGGNDSVKRSVTFARCIRDGVLFLAAELCVYTRGATTY